jgi:hypothetical protein
MACGCEERHDGIIVSHDIIFGDAQLEIENVEEFPLDSADIALAEYTGAHSPVYVFQR